MAAVETQFKTLALRSGIAIVLDGNLCKLKSHSTGPRFGVERNSMSQMPRCTVARRG